MTRLQRFRKNRYNIELYVDSYRGFLDLIFPAFEKELLNLPIEGTLVVDKSFRPDYISYKLYNTFDLWWAILMFNGISIFNFVAGKEIRFFSIGDFEELAYNYFLKARRR